MVIIKRLTAKGPVLFKLFCRNSSPAARTGSRYSPASARKIRLTGLLLVACLLFSPARALEKDRYTESEKVGFAFFNLIKAEPDFESWIRETQKYKDAKPSKKVQMLTDDLRRLETGFISYYPDEDLISVEAKARVEASEYFHASQREGTVTHVKIKLPDMPQGYFPFQIGDMWIALIIEDFEKMTNYDFNPEQYKEFATKLRFDRYSNQFAMNVNVDFKFMPVSADGEGPIEMDGINMWLMLGEMVEMRLWVEYYGEKKYLWEYRADWYIPEEHQQLLDLYKK